jgi:hypothetical protein
LFKPIYILVCTMRGTGIDERARPSKDPRIEKGRDEEAKEEVQRR